MPTCRRSAKRSRVLMPITSPRRSKVGPPELPRLIGASICRKIVELTGADVAAARRDDAGRDAAAEPERVADRDDPIADLRRAAVAERT